MLVGCWWCLVGFNWWGGFVIVVGYGGHGLWVVVVMVVVLYGFCTLCWWCYMDSVLCIFFFIVGVSNFLYVILICVYIIFMY